MYTRIFFIKLKFLLHNYHIQTRSTIDYSSNSLIFYLHNFLHLARNTQKINMAYFIQGVHGKFRFSDIFLERWTIQSVVV